MPSPVGKPVAILMNMHYPCVNGTGPRLFFKMPSNRFSAQFWMFRMRPGSWRVHKRRQVHGWWLSQFHPHISNNELRIVVSLRLAVPTCVEHTCICNEKVGILGLKCRKSKGRWSCHQSVNDIIARALTLTNVPAILKLSGLYVRATSGRTE